MTTRKPYPTRRMADAFLDFASPLLDAPQRLPLFDILNDDMPEWVARELLGMAYTTWNAVVFADVLENPRHLNELRRQTAPDPDFSALIEQLIDRKRTLFADDQRTIGKWEMTWTPSGISLTAVAHDTWAALGRPN